jgi:hypothetical protein
MSNNVVVTRQHVKTTYVASGLYAGFVTWSMYKNIYMEHSRWCHNHQIYQYFQSKPINILRKILLRGN